MSKGQLWQDSVAVCPADTTWYVSVLCLAIYTHRAARIVFYLHPICHCSDWVVCVCVIIITQDFYIRFIKINKENKEIAIGQQFTWPHRYTLTLATQYTTNNIIKLVQDWYLPVYRNATSLTLTSTRLTSRTPPHLRLYTWLSSHLRSPKGHGWPFKLF